MAVVADDRTGARPAVSSIRRTRRTSSGISWTCGVNYALDLHTTLEPLCTGAAKM